MTRVTQGRFSRFEVDGRVAVITIDRPEVLNALHHDAHVELERAFDRFRDDPSLHVAIVTGAGARAFCVGSDLKALAASGDHTKPATGFGGITHRFDLFKPVIAAVNGLCLGGGVEIVAACDLAIAADDAQFGLPEPLVGLAALGGGVLQRLPRQMAMKDAMWMVLTADRLPASEAARLRLVNEVVPRARLLSRAAEVAAKILRCAPLALQASKQVMLQSARHADLQAAMHADYPLARTMLESRDAREGPVAFAQKRPPVWEGR
ncbi:MAG: enoyl-CoA hydratase-related protein [Lautropia sp.]